MFNSTHLRGNRGRGLIATQAGREVLAEVEKHKQAPSSRCYREASVESSTGSSVRMVSQLLLYTHTEFRRAMGTHARSKDPSVPKVHLRSVRGDVQEFFVFKPTEASDLLWHRRLELSSYLETRLQENILQATEHMHKAQATETLGFVQNSVLTSSAVDGLLGPQAWGTFSGVREYRDRSIAVIASQDWRAMSLQQVAVMKVCFVMARGSGTAGCHVVQ